MKNRRMNAGFLILATCLLAATGLAATDEPGGMFLPVMPNQFDEAWEGVWDFHVVVEDCDTGFQLWTDDYETTFCAGDEFEPDQDPSWDDVDCVGGITGNELNFSCTMTTEVDLSCTGFITMTQQLTLSGETITGTMVMEMDLVGTGCFITYSCNEFHYTATRIDPDPTDCDPQSNEAASWSDVKGIYR